MGRYDDCESCAFDGVESAICDGCEDGDMWEPADPLDQMAGGSYYKTTVIKFKKRPKLKEAA